MRCPKCGVELSEVHPDEISFLEKIGLKNHLERQRIDYVNKVVECLAQALIKINIQPNNLEKLKLFKQFMEEWEQKGEPIILTLLYSVKPEYRDTYIQLLEVLTRKT